MKDKALRVLNWFRLIDDGGLLSVTNLAVWVVVGKLAVAREVDFAAVGGLLTVLGAYNFKKWHREKHKNDKTPDDKVQELKEKIDRVALAAGLKR